MMRYRSFETERPDYQPMEFWTSGEDETEDIADWLRTQSQPNEGWTETQGYTAEVVDFPTADGPSGTEG
jgi:hypothetical protein